LKKGIPSTAVHDPRSETNIHREHKLSIQQTYALILHTLRQLPIVYLNFFTHMPLIHRIIGLTQHRVIQISTYRVIRDKGRPSVSIARSIRVYSSETVFIFVRWPELKTLFVMTIQLNTYLLRRGVL